MRVQSLKFKVQSLNCLLLSLALASGFPICSHAQGTLFQNLNFEAANIPPGTQPGTTLSTSAILPGWVPSVAVDYDDASGGGTLISIDDSNAPFALSSSPLQGKYSVVLFAGPDIGAAGSVSISQTGLVPANALSILMDVAFSPSVLYTTTLGGQQIVMMPLRASANYTVYGGNISAYAGQVEALTITQFPPAPPTVPPSALELDNILFSVNPVPEPGTYGLLLCGAAVFGVTRWKRRASSTFQV
jgi:hypothetical protein